MKGFQSIKNIKSKYTWKKQLGSGSFGAVYEAVHAIAETPVAIKVINKKTVQAAPVYVKLMKQELEVLEELDHPHIVRVIELLEDDSNYYVVMELLQDGNLLDFLNNISKRKVSFRERDAANLTNQILLALNYMHTHNPPIAHRDLKLENIMIQQVANPASKELEVILKVTDFGFAVHVDPNKGEKLSLGSPMYTAPEVIKAKEYYDERCDVWSLGIMTYMMLSNKPPFAGEKKEDIYRKALNYEPDYACFSKFYQNGSMCTDFLK